MSIASPSSSRIPPEEQTLERVDRACGRINSSPLLPKATLPGICQFITETLADTLACTRASLWQLSLDSSKFRCLDCFDTIRLKHSSDLVLPRQDHPVLFASMESRTLEIIRGKDNGPLAREFDAYMDLHGLQATLIAPMRAPDSQTLLIVFEHSEKGHAWNQTDKRGATIIGAMVCRLIADKLHSANRATNEDASQQLNQIIDFLPDPAFIINPQGVVQAWNEAIERMTGVPKDLIIGHGDHLHSVAFYGVQRPMLIDLALNPDAAAEKDYDAFSRKGDTVTGEAHVGGINSSHGAILFGSARPLYDRTGRVIGAIESIRDITSLKNAEQIARDWKRRYEMVSAASRQITYEQNLETNGMQWSNTSAPVLGFELQEKAPTHAAWLSLIHPEDRVRVEHLQAESEHSGAAIAVEYRVLTTQGTLWFNDHSYISSDSLGHRCKLGMIVDITKAKIAEEQIRTAQEELERRVKERTSQLAQTNARLVEEIDERSKAQHALGASEQKYRLMVDALPQIVFEMDLQGRVLLLNSQGYELGGLTPDDLRSGISMFDFIEPEDHPRLKANFAKIMEGGPNSGQEYHFIGRKGTRFVVTSYARLVKTDGKPSFITGFLIDESPRIKAREALERAHAELEVRVAQRTAELAASNLSMKDLLHRQEINIGMASRILAFINSRPSRNYQTPDGGNLFVAAQLIPRDKEGGDHFFSRVIGSGTHLRTLISLKDQSGHEVGCILRSISTDLYHNALLSRAESSASLSHTMGRLNQELCNSNLFADGEYLTAVTLEIRHESLQLNYLTAGHPPFLHVRGDQVTLLPGTDRQGANLPLGMIETAAFRHSSLQLQYGDKIILYTDGLLDLPTNFGEQALSSQALANFVSAILKEDPSVTATRLAHKLLIRLGQSDSPYSPHDGLLPDDLSLVVVELEPPKGVEERVLNAPNVIELSRQRNELISHLYAQALARGLPIDRMRLSMVLEEAIVNAWKHGGRESADARITVKHWIGNDLHIEISDPGEGFDYDKAPDPTSPENLTKPSGRGIFMIRRFSDQAEWTDKGRRLRLQFAPGPGFVPPKHSGHLTSFNLWS